MNIEEHWNSSNFIEDLNGAGFQHVGNAGLILLGGETRVDYLQRQTSNDLDMLAEGKAVPNILPNPNGRVIEMFINIQWEDEIALLTPSDRGPKIYEYFKKRIFFNDRVELTDKSSEWDQFVVLGDKAANRITSIFAFPSPIEKNELQTGRFKEHKVFGLGLKEIGGLPSNLLIVPTSESEGVRRELISAEINELSSIDFERFRISNGIPGPKEYSGSFTPFELGMDEYVSTSKGCYTGQEVLARQVNYKKVAKVRATILAEEKVETEDKLLFSGQEIGKISSAAPLSNGKTLALAIVKKTKVKTGDKITVKSGENTIKAEISRVF